MDLEKTLKIISVTGSHMGNAHKALCYELDREIFRIRLSYEHKEADSTLNLLSLTKIILIEDMDLSVHILNYRNELQSFRNMDIYYAYYDTLASFGSNSIRLTQESFHSDCYTQKMFNSPKSNKLDVIELRRGISTEDSAKMFRKQKAVSKIQRSKFEEVVDKSLYNSIVGLFMKVFDKRIISVIFWEQDKVLGLMLDDYNTIPLKLNEGSYNSICKLLNYNE